MISVSEFKTVQKTLAEIKKKRLANVYIDKYVDDQTVHKFGKKKIRKDLKSYIKYLTKLDGVKPQAMVAFVSHMASKDQASPEPSFTVQYLDNLGDYSQRLALDLTPMKKTLGVLVAPTWRTQHYLYELLADLLNEITFTGWHQEELQKRTDSLEKAIKECEEDSDSMKSYTMDELYDELGIDRSEFDEFDSYEYRLNRQMQVISNKIWKHSFDKESRKVKRLVDRDDFVQNVWNQNKKKSDNHDN